MLSVPGTTTTTIRKNDDDNSTNDSIDNDINDIDDDHTLTSSRSHPTLTHYATHLVSASHPRCIARLVNTKKPSLFPLHRLARLRVTRPLHHLSSGRLRSCPCRWPSSPFPDRSLATCKPHFPRLGLGNALRLTQPLRPRPTPFGSSCISSRHPRPNRLFRRSYPTRLRPKPGRIFPSPRCQLEYKA